MHNFFKIINVSYSDKEIGILTWWADELMKDCDAYCASGLTLENEDSIKVFDTEWDFPEPPNICR